MTVTRVDGEKLQEYVVIHHVYWNVFGQNSDDID